jgi:hypothetical protein
MPPQGHSATEGRPRNMTASVRAPQRWHKISAMAGIVCPRAEVLHTPSGAAHACPRLRGQARGSRTFREIRAESAPSEAPMSAPAEESPTSAGWNSPTPGGVRVVRRGSDPRSVNDRGEEEGVLEVEAGRDPQDALRRAALDPRDRPPHRPRPKTAQRAIRSDAPPRYARARAGSKLDPFKDEIERCCVPTRGCRARGCLSAVRGRFLGCAACVGGPPDMSLRTTLRSFRTLGWRPELPG